MIDETGFEIKSYRTCSNRRISQMKYDFWARIRILHTHTFVIILLLLCRNAVKNYKNGVIYSALQ